MTAKELREKYVKFFENKGHKKLDSFPLIPDDKQQLEGKEKVLFTSAGMQPLIPYLTGKEEPPSRRLVDCQKCLRTDDIDEVGDTTHHTFFEMLGNWSIGDYWKKEAIEYSFEFLTKELKLPVKKVAVSVFAGDSDAPRDEESAVIWQQLGIPMSRIFYLGKEHNWWPTAKREQDSGEFKEPFGPCGPDTEMFFWTGDGEPQGGVDEDKRWVEIWNNVFMEYNRKDDGTLEKLPMQSVDTGMGLERALAVLNGKESAYETDLFEGILKAIKQTERETETDDKVVADHLRAAVMLIKEGVLPSNKLEGYVLRRLLRRAMVKLNRKLRDFVILDSHVKEICDEVLKVYDGFYGINRDKDREEIFEVIQKEFVRFGQNLNIGLAKLEKMGAMTGKDAFDFYQSYGFPRELTEELLKEKGQKIDRIQFESEFKKHQEVSRGVSAGEFKGGLADHSDITVRGHTATHLLHQALRDVLGNEVHQTGSNITPERIRFDFSYGEKLTAEQIKQVETIVNEKIKEDLKVKKELMSQKDANEKGAIGLFKEKYEEKVSIYEIGNYSTEYCGGPHVEHTSQVGTFKIIKEESVSAGQRRIKATLS